MAKRNAGDLGAYRITATEDGATIEHLSSPLPTNKEVLEAVFAEGFIKAYGEQKLFDGKAPIEAHEQQNTGDLDYRIKCERADYLELAEVTPLSEDWGREALQSGVLDIYKFGYWIWQNIIVAKASKYGETTSHRTFLLLYSTHPQLMASQNVIALLRSTLQRKGCPFAAVFYCMLIGGDSPFVEVLAPWTERMPPPRKFKGLKLQNLDIAKAEVVAGGISMKADI